MNMIRQNIQTELERQLLEALQEFVVPSPEHLRLVSSFVSLGNVAGVQHVVPLLAACVRAAVTTSIQLAELRASSGVEQFVEDGSDT